MSEPGDRGGNGGEDRAGDESLESMLPELREDETSSAPTREASVRLRADGGSGEQAINDMHAANESLAAAFRTMYRLLQLAIVGLVVIYVLSGINSVNAGESGIKVRFGRPAADTVPPGITWNFPYPLGQLIRVQTGQRTVQLEEEFWFRVDERDRGRSLEELARSPRRSLDPERDGALITSDQNLVHTQWTVVYRREDPREFASNITPDDEQQIVRTAVQRGVIRAVSTTAIDDLLRETGAAGGVASRAQRIAQETLEAIDAGIVVEQLTMRTRTPPLSVWQAFTEVQTAESQSQTQRVQADSFASNELSRVAGAAARPILDLIYEYEQAVELEQQAEQEIILDKIHRLMAGEPVEIDGEIQSFAVSGEVSLILNIAQQQRVEAELSAKLMLELYNAKLPQFRENPDLVLQSDWSRMMASVLGRDTVEVIKLPLGDINLMVNPDPEIRRLINEIEQERLNRAAQDRRDRRERDREFRTDTEMREFGG
ncbi:MAG: SPFH domain-containing protein [Phycisphaerales bacterium]|jgi:regulator of protease activity HflC (stomatin/prohibitin superfamily)